MAGRRLVPVLLMLGVAAAGCGSGSAAARPVARGAASGAASGAAQRFLTRYVTPDGRVLRRDQGGDIVSEGQAYGMLIAEIAGKPAVARTIWAWTSRHLGRPDGLFAWHATGQGQVLDPQSATDADILLAYALLRYRGPGAGTLHAAGRRVAGAVLANESVALPGGAPLPVAGPWARSASPPVVNPSYLMPGVFQGLARLTGDGRWAAAARAATGLVGRLTGGGRRLPPDWAALAGPTLQPIPQPGGGAGVQYGQDAARAPVWFATACDPVARRLAAAWWRDVLRRDDRAAASALTLTGAPVQAAPSPLTLMAGAAAATAAGDTGAAAGLRSRAQALAGRDPTYYGDAWAVLAPALLDGALAPCSGG